MEARTSPRQPSLPVDADPRVARWQCQLETDGVIVVSPDGSIPHFGTKASRPAKLTGIGSRYFAEAEFITLQ